MAGTNQDQFKQPFLSEQEQALGKQAFETAVQPLRESLQSQLDVTTEQLAKRGAFFGGTGQEAFRERVIKPRAEREAQIAGGIATSLGQTALQQAFQANEAAKQRQLQQQLQKSGFEFQEEQAGLGRAFTAEQAGLERSSREQLQQLGIEAQQQESALGREFSGEQAGLQREFQREQLTQQQQFAAQESQFARDFTKEENRLGRELTREESQALRDFQSSESGRQRDFVSEQAAFDRELQTEQARLGRELTQDESQLLRDFNEEQSRLDRAQQFGLQGAEFENRERLVRMESEFQNDRIAAQQTFQAEQALLDRTLTQEEAANQRTFNQRLQEEDFAFRGTQADIDRQRQKEQQVLELVRSGNIAQEDVSEILGGLLGEGAVLTTDDEADLQRIAAASGLSVDDYKNIRGAIGTAQGELILGTHQGQVSNDEGQPLYVDQDGNETTEATSTIKKPNTPPWSKETITVDNEQKLGEVPNINDFIQDPGAQRRFAMQIAKIEANLQKDIAREESAGGKVLCTELYRQGRLPEDIYAADSRHGATVDPVTVVGYHAWGVPLAGLMKKSKVVTAILEPLIKAWAYQMAYKEGVVDRPNTTGKVLEAIGLPLCRFIGSLIVEKRGVVNG